MTNKYENAARDYVSPSPPPLEIPDDADQTKSVSELIIQWVHEDEEHNYLRIPEETQRLEQIFEEWLVF